MRGRSKAGWSLACGVAVALLFRLATGASAGAAPATPAFQTLAPYAVLVDAESGAVLFDKHADDLVAPASTAKIMTAEIVFEQLADGRLKLDDTFAISEHAWRTGGALSGGSTMFAALNSRVRIEDLIRGLVVVSGNDAAIALAEGIAGTEEGFATLMNERARALGLTRSHFVNPWGRGDPAQKVTAREMAILARHIIATFPDHYRYFGERDFLWNRVRQSNRNPLLALNIGADGLKTGDIAESGFGLVGSAVQNGRRLIVVVNGLRTAKDRANEAEKLLSWGFRAFEARTVFAPGETVGHARVFGGDSMTVPLRADGPVNLLQPREGSEPLTGRIVYDGPLPAPLEEGQLAAHLKIMRGGSEVLDVPLRTAQKVPVGSLARRAVDAGLELMAGAFRTNVFKR